MISARRPHRGPRPGDPDGRRPGPPHCGSPSGPSPRACRCAPPRTSPAARAADRPRRRRAGAHRRWRDAALEALRRRLRRPRCACARPAPARSWSSSASPTRTPCRTRAGAPRRLAGRLSGSSPRRGRVRRRAVAPPSAGGDRPACPPARAARSSIAARPRWPSATRRPRCAGSKPRPSSRTSMTTCPPSARAAIATAGGSAWRRMLATASCTMRKATVRWVSERASAAATSRDDLHPPPLQALDQRARGRREAQLLERHRVQVDDRAPQGAHRLAAPTPRRGSRRPPPRARRRPAPRASASSIRPTPDELLHRAVVEVLGHPPPLVLLGQHDGRGEGPPLALLAPQVGQQARVGQRHRGLVGQPAAGAPRRPSSKAVAARARHARWRRRPVAPVGRRHGHGDLAAPAAAGPPSAAATASRSAAASASPSDGRRGRPSRRRPRRRAGTSTAASARTSARASRHDDAVGLVALVQWPATRRATSVSARELARLTVELARPVAQAGEQAGSLRDPRARIWATARALARSVVAHRPPAGQHERQGPDRAAAGRAGTTTPPSRPLRAELAGAPRLARHARARPQSAATGAPAPLRAQRLGGGAAGRPAARSASAPSAAATT